MASNLLLTIGHAALPIEDFISLLKKANVHTVCDVRSSPFSRFAPQFNSQPVAIKLTQSNIAYKFMGEKLGGRIKIQSCYVNGRIDYSKVEKTSLFQDGISNLLETINTGPTAIMCSEKDPLNCHRYLLISKHLKHADVEIRHILHSGQIEHNLDTENRLFKVTRTENVDLFEDSSALLEKAYRTQADKVSFVAEDTIQ